MGEEELVLQDRIQLDQEDSNRILAIGHKVLWEGNAYIISDIRVWHDLDSMVPGEKRCYPVCDLASASTGRRVVTNARFEELSLWHRPFARVTAAATKPA